MVGSVSVVAFFGLGALSILLLWRKAMFFEILLGFFFILILSDNLRYTTDFAKVFKNAYVVLVSLIAILERRRLGTQIPILKYFIPFIAIAVVGLVSSPIVFKSFQKTLSYALILFTVPVFITYAYKERGPIIFKDMVWVAVSMLFVGFLMRFINPGIAYSHGGRFRAVFGNPNGLGVFASLLFAFVLVIRDYFGSLFSKNDLRWILLPILLAILMSGSRTALLGVALFFVFSRVYKISPLLGFVGVLGAAFAAELLSANLVLIVEALGLSDFLRIDTLEDGSGRYLAWIFAWENIQEHYWFGRGFAFDEWLMAENQEMLNELGHQGGVHNTYLIIWLNTGLVGLVMFLRAYFLLFMKGAKNSRFSFPVLWMVVFSITLEPWLAASLNPFTILLLCCVTLMVGEVFQENRQLHEIQDSLDEEVPALT